ncbi:hypothetical protein [Rubinisphaera italica]|uniref:Caspase domain protein n=1 Tax=Rubinisphaera italica TaxID=2527969 RepID=A0A5C5XCF3_9PLAN|nr:hypothetical protein [Rubinisphaera italica]TWT60468.1 hypothetical protein Pan54_11820 [Rubinisphaera italica]
MKMVAALFVLLLCSVSNTFGLETPSNTSVIVVVGESGESSYETMFVEWSRRWERAAIKSQSQYQVIGTQNSTADEQDRDALSRILKSMSLETPETLWIVLIGHGTFDGSKAKFNLRGPDITAAELNEQLSAISCRIAFINCASASGPFIGQLSAKNRVIVTATQSGFESNFARFGEYLSTLIDDPTADLDKDGQTSLLEAWLAASKQTQEYYDSNSQLATEHSVLDDNADHKGTPADWFRGLHLIKSTTDDFLPDGTFASQFILVPDQNDAALSEELRSERDQLEVELARLRQRKAAFTESEYLKELESLLIPLAEIYRKSKTESDDNRNKAD